MKKLLIFICAVAFSMSIVAQDNFKEGYIIENKGDTIRGWIDYRTTRMNNHQCRFRTAEADKIVIYNPGEIAGYRFTNEGKYYVSREIPIGENQPQTVFLEYLISGILDLFLYEDSKAIYYLFENEKGEMVVVQKSSTNNEYVYKDGRTYQQKDLKYIGMLNYVFKESPSVLQKIGESSIKESNIIALTKKYHEDICTTGEECIVFEGKPDKKYHKIGVGIYGGIGSYTCESIGESSNKCSNALKQTVGVEFNMSIPRWNKSMLFFIDLSYSTLRKNDGPHVGKYIQTTINLKSWFAEGKFGTRYIFNKKKRFQPIADGSFIISYMDNSSTRKKSEALYYYEVTEFGWRSPKAWLVGFSVGTGVNIVTIKDQYVFLRAGYSKRYSSYMRNGGFGFDLGYGF